LEGDERTQVHDSIWNQEEWRRPMHQGVRLVVSFSATTKEQRKSWDLWGCSSDHAEIFIFIIFRGRERGGKNTASRLTEIKEEQFRGIFRAVMSIGMKR
jgi:hypothetical protein